MDQDDVIIGQILSRRAALRATALAGLSFAAAGLISRSARAATPAPTTQPHLPLVASPQLTEGPFFVDEKLNRSNLLDGTKRASVINGLPLALAFTVYKLSGKDYQPMTGATVDVWHADAAGAYSDESNPMTHENTSKETWLRGYQVTDAAGNVSFNTIFPGWYQGRAPHIHFKVRQFSKENKTTAEFTSQVFFIEADADKIYANPPYANTRGKRDTRNRDDGVFAEKLTDGSLAGDHMLLDLNKTADDKGYTTAFPIILTDASLQGAARGHGGGGPGGRRGPGGPPPGGFGGPPPLDR